MNKSIVSDLWNKTFRQGNPLYFLIGVNVLVFLILGLIGALTALGLLPSSIQSGLLGALQMPATLSAFIWKPWTIVTYMFTQLAFFHILFNMLWLFWLGQIFLNFLNGRQLLFTYLAGGLLGGLLYLLSYNIIPTFADRAAFVVLIGSSASVSAVVFATATLVPDYSIRMLFFGNVKLKYLALAFIVLDLLGVGTANAGGSIAHIGGALMGVVFIRQLRKGKDWSWILKRKKKGKLRVFSVTGGAVNRKEPGFQPETNSQDVIDIILDKISVSGYDSLTKAEKDALFRASKEEKK